MSKTEAARFIDAHLTQHPDLKQRLAARVDRQKLASDLAQIGANAGYQFSEAEILETLSAMPSGELSDDEMQAVAGGSGFATATAKVDLEYKPQKADGSLAAGIHFKYDIKANKEG